MFKVQFSILDQKYVFEEGSSVGKTADAHFISTSPMLKNICDAILRLHRSFYLLAKYKNDEKECNSTNTNLY